MPGKRNTARGNEDVRTESRRAPTSVASPVEGPVLVDSGPLLALFNAADHWHLPVRHWLETHPAVRLITTWPVLTEVCALLARRIHNQAALDFLLWIERGAVQVDIPTDTSLPAVHRIAQRFASLPLDLADASIAEAAARSAFTASSASMQTSMSTGTREERRWSICCAERRWIVIFDQQLRRQVPVLHSTDHQRRVAL